MCKEPVGTYVDYVTEYFMLIDDEKIAAVMRPQFYTFPVQQQEPSLALCPCPVHMIRHTHDPLFPSPCNGSNTKITAIISK
jgi:hypothetical protein